LVDDDFRNRCPTTRNSIKQDKKRKILRGASSAVESLLEANVVNDNKTIKHVIKKQLSIEQQSYAKSLATS
jgi:hypothetical protein